jgi:glycosidase
MTMGVTHVWYTGVIEHATKTDYSKDGIKPCNKHVVKGNAGSPYAIRDYYDIDPDLAVNVRRRMAEFENLVERTHNEGLKVIIDFVPNHVAREYHSDAKPRNVSDLGGG